ncbi:MAG: phosphate acyltransferase PlsX [Candidatus Eremiobacteraeota bacterium]|nr:phosphate acyltransferase PlsX [Candidatus Eremiobacteraeota bacterium]MBV8355785.1 phosphate acyltransferase PlsX [Candidatus Eremiobacteraeota bacterium]
MGGDHAPGEIVAGTLRAHADGFGRMILVGDEARLAPLVRGRDGKSIEIVHAPGVVPMDAPPSQQVRTAGQSSLGIAISLVRDGRADAVVSAGSSGAFLAIAFIRLRTIAGIARPAIAAILPTPRQPVVLIDAGANVDCKPEWLMQFAIMGSAYAQAVLGMQNPRVGIVSIGEERGKGNAQVIEAAELLERAPINFIGNTEGRDVFSGRADVLVTDGFVGNVMLKLAEAEGVALQGFIRESLLSSGPDVKLGALLTRRAFAKVRRQLHYESYGGAPLLGLRGNCIVAHGRSNRTAFRNAIRVAATEVREDVVGKIGRLVAPLVAEARA